MRKNPVRLLLAALLIAPLLALSACSDDGTYTVSGNTVAFRYPDDPDDGLSGTLSGNTLTVSFNGESDVAVFRK